MKKLWKILRGVYRWSHENFDVDFDNCCLLTNLHIKNNNLEEVDRIFLLQVSQQKIQLHEHKEEKRKESRRAYKLNKKRKLEALQEK